MNKENMSRTTKTRFEHCNSQPIDVFYYDKEKYVCINKVGKDEIIEEQIYLDYDEIKRINRIINKNKNCV